MAKKRISFGSKCRKCLTKINTGEVEYYASYGDEEEIWCENCGEENIRNREEADRKEGEKELDKIRASVDQALTEISQIRVKEDNLSTFTADDYKKIKDWKQKIDKLSKKNLDDDPFLKTNVEILQTSLQELEELVPKRIKIAFDFNEPKFVKEGKGGKSREIPKKTCSHTNNIVYEEDKPYSWYCEKCGDDNSLKFLKVLQKDIASDIREEWINKYKFSSLDLITNDNYNKLFATSYTSQEEIAQAYQRVEEKIKELLRSKGINIEETERERERERERAD